MMNIAALIEKIDAYFNRGVSWVPVEAGEWQTIRDALPVWKPIETAPKNDGRILLRDSKYGLGTVVAGWGYPNDYPERGEWQVINSIVCKNPTHWMPLPKPPEKA